MNKIERYNNPKTKEKSFLYAMPYLPFDILIDHIFIRLPVRSLLRFRCVCKQWLRSLTESTFMTMHLNHQKIHNHLNILCASVHYKEGLFPYDFEKARHALSGAFCGGFYSLNLKLSSPVAVPLLGFPIHLEEYRFIETLGYCTGMLGYCNGMVCMEIHDVSETNFSKERQRLLIGNPATGDYKILSDPTSQISPSLFIGFGCDSSVDDYKLVIVDNVTRNPSIYSLKLKSWITNLDSSDNYAIKPEKYSNRNAGVAHDRSVYWLVEISNIIVEFDFKDAEFRQLPLPRNMYSAQHAKLTLRVLGGSLCIINDCYREKNAVEIWCLWKREENNNSCWSKLMTLTLSPFIRKIFRIHPLSFMKDGKVLCFCTEYDDEENSFVLINPKTNRVEDISIRDETGSDWLKQYSFVAPRHLAPINTHMAYIDTFVSPN